jgi:hypothetical protein
VRLEENEVEAQAAVKPEANLFDELERVARRIREGGLLIRVSGGLAVHHWCPSSSREPYRRSYTDLDLLVSGRVRAAVVDGFMSDLGYIPGREFNALHGQRQLYYADPANARHVDVFVECLCMCHVIRLGPRLELSGAAVNPSDLLLTKLQIVELDQKDIKDVLVLLCDKQLVSRPTELDRVYLGKVWGSDWPLWRACRGSRARVAEDVGRIADTGERDRAVRVLEDLNLLVRDCPKTAKWKARSIVGDRIRWYDLPEEIGEEE